MTFECLDCKKGKVSSCSEKQTELPVELTVTRPSPASSISSTANKNERVQKVLSIFRNKFDEVKNKFHMVLSDGAQKSADTLLEEGADTLVAYGEDAAEKKGVEKANEKIDELGNLLVQRAEERQTPAPATIKNTFTNNFMPAGAGKRPFFPYVPSSAFRDAVKAFCPCFPFCKAR